MDNYLFKILEKVLLGLGLVSFAGAVVYRVYALNWFGVILTLFLGWYAYKKIHKHFDKKESVVGKIIIKLKKRTENKKKFKFSRNEIIGGLMYGFLFVLSILVLLENPIDASVISVWEYIPLDFLVYYLLATAALIFNISYNTRIGLVFIIMHYFLSFAVILLTYRIGYGFDPFVHQATLELIDENGVVYPKPMYYLGQYSVVIILHKLSFIPISILDKFLVPVLASVALPIVLVKAIVKFNEDKKSALLICLALLSIPFSFFIMSTPQNLAYLFLILVLLFGMICNSYIYLATIYVLALATLAIQPIAGIPAVLFAGFITVAHSEFRFKKFLYASFTVANAIALPLAFYITERSNTGTELSETGERTSLFTIPPLAMPEQGSFILNYVYLYGFNVGYVVLALIVFGAYIYLKGKKNNKVFGLYLLSAITLYISFLITKLLPFDFLIDYERANYTNRILLITGFFLLPFVLLGISKIVETVLRLDKYSKLVFSVFLVLIIGTSLYLSYPRHDMHFNSRGYSTGKSDIAAVNWIHDDAGDVEYIVLANQQVGAAALHEYGFSKYYKGDIFYYPIPTGGPLYQYYLKMVYETPSRETMIEAMDLVGVDRAYFVLNKYWWASAKLVEEAKIVSDGFEVIDEGEVFVFRFDR